MIWVLQRYLFNGQLKGIHQRIMYLTSRLPAVSMTPRSGTLRSMANKLGSHCRLPDSSRNPENRPRIMAKQQVNDMGVVCVFSSISNHTCISGPYSGIYVNASLYAKHLTSYIPTSNT